MTDSKYGDDVYIDHGCESEEMHQGKECYVAAPIIKLNLKVSLMN